MSTATPEQLHQVETFVHEVVTRVTEGDQPSSLDDILPLVYPEFRALASYMMQGERGAHTLQPTGLANEAYLRLANQRSPLKGEAHLLALAATTMRRVLVDYARSKGAAKRGADRERVTLKDDVDGTGDLEFDAIDLHRTLEVLSAQDPRKAQVVELLYFGGLTFDETGKVLGVATRTVVRDWKFAKAWLYNELSGDNPAT